MEIKVLASSSKGNCYTVSDGTTKLLIECGLPWKEIQRRTRFAVDHAGCLVTHEHKDHCKAAQDVMFAGIDVYSTWGTFNAAHLGGRRSNVVQPLEPFTVGTWAILPFPTVHDCAEPLGFLLASKNGIKCLFATDTMYLRYKFSGLTHIMLETNYSMDILRQNVARGRVDAAVKNRVVRSHMSLETAKDFLRANDLHRVEAIWLIHLSDDNSDAERFRREIMAATGKPVYVAGEKEE